MTPEAENELVARWMGWEWHDEAGEWRNDHSESDGVPPYRTDPALLWEVMERIMGYPYWWMFQRYGEPDRAEGMNFDRDSVTAVTMAEAVFAAAVMQAEQEGK